MLRDGTLSWFTWGLALLSLQGLPSVHPECSSSVPVSVLAVTSPALMLSSACDVAACCCL